MKSETVQRLATPTAMLVGLSEPLSTTCSETLGDGGLKVLRAAHVAAASERIPVVMPQLVVVETEMSAAELEILADRCVAVGAEVLAIAPKTDLAKLYEILAAAGNRALKRAATGG